MHLAEWAAVAEILGMVTVIVSLLLVVQSISQNTAAMHTANDNFIYERQDAIITTLVTDPSMAELQIKHQNNEQLSEVEQKDQACSRVFSAKSFNVLRCVPDR